jgi:hypothetical protein
MIWSVRSIKEMAWLVVVKKRCIPIERYLTLVQVKFRAGGLRRATGRLSSLGMAAPTLKEAATIPVYQSGEVFDWHTLAHRRVSMATKMSSR